MFPTHESDIRAILAHDKYPNGWNMEQRASEPSAGNKTYLSYC